MAAAPLGPYGGDATMDPAKSSNATTSIIITGPPNLGLDDVEAEGIDSTSLVKDIVSKYLNTLKTTGKINSREFRNYQDQWGLFPEKNMIKLFLYSKDWDRLLIAPTTYETVNLSLAYPVEDNPSISKKPHFVEIRFYSSPQSR